MPNSLNIRSLVYGKLNLNYLREKEKLGFVRVTKIRKKEDQNIKNPFSGKLIIEWNKPLFKNLTTCWECIEFKTDGIIRKWKKPKQSFRILARIRKRKKNRKT